MGKTKKTSKYERNEHQAFLINHKIPHAYAVLNNDPINRTIYIPLRWLQVECFDYSTLIGNKMFAYYSSDPMASVPSISKVRKPEDLSAEGLYWVQLLHVSDKNYIHTKQKQKPVPSVDTDRLKTCENKLIASIENAFSNPSRIQDLEVVRESIAKRYLPSIVEKQKDKILQTLDKVIRQSKLDDVKIVCLQLVPMMMMQLENPKNVFAQIWPLVINMLDNTANSSGLRSECCRALALFHIFAGNDGDQIMPLLCRYVEIIVNADASSVLLSTALRSWALVVSILNAKEFATLVKSRSCFLSMPTLMNLLDSAQVRLAAGDVIALLVECARKHNTNVFDKHQSELISITQQIAHPDNKYQIPKTHRATFLDILRFVETNTMPKWSIKFERETLDLGSWSLRLRYSAVCALIGAGMTKHLTENLRLRQVLELGDTVIHDYWVNIVKDREIKYDLKCADIRRTVTRDRDVLRAERVG